MNKLMILLLVVMLLLATAGVAYAGPVEKSGATIPLVAKDLDSPACLETDADPCSGMGASKDSREITANGAIPGP